VRSSESYKLEIRANDWWGEPLAGLLAECWWSSCRNAWPAARLRRKRRHHRRPQTASSASTSSGSTRQGGLADPGRAGRRRVQPPRRTAAPHLTITKPVATQDTPGLVAAISDAVGELADGIATLLQ